MVTVRMEALAFHKAALAIGRIRQLSLAPIRQTKRSVDHPFGAARSRITADVLAAVRRPQASNIAASAVRRRVPAVATAMAMRHERRDNLWAHSNAVLRNANLHEVAHVLGHNASQFAKVGLGHTRYKKAMVAAKGYGQLNTRALVGGIDDARLPRYPQSGRLAAIRHVEKPLPSVAPMGRSGGQNRVENYARDRKWQAETYDGSAITEPKMPALTLVNKAHLSNALADLLNREARLPPSGATGFDPRLSPAWPGLKLPN